MGKRIRILLLLTVCLLVLAGCSCSHSWTEATCTAPAACSKCGQIQGLATRHNYLPATCEAPETCEGCGKVQGEAAGHNFEGNGCVSSCVICGAEDPAATGHGWEEADCEAAKHCTLCGLTEGEPLGHSWLEATCQMPKTCDRCAAVEGWRNGHVLGVRDTGAAIHSGTCAVCNKMVEHFIHRDKIYAWTEYDVAEDGTYGKPVTYVRGASITFNDRGEFVRVDWFDDTGKQQYFAATQVDTQLTCVAFYKDGNIYYFPLNQFNNAPVVKDILLELAGKYISFESSSFDYYDSIYYPNYTILYLHGPGGEGVDDIGYVRTAYDKDRNPYTIIVNDQTGEIWVDKGSWKY